MGKLRNLEIKLQLFYFLKIEKLSQAKYQDNLEFAQWFQRFYDLSGTVITQDYDPVVRRGQTDTDFSFVDYRENPRVVQMKRDRQRFNQLSADARYNSFASKGGGGKDNSRSKSPLFKGDQGLANLHSKSKDLTLANQIKVSQFSFDDREYLLQKIQEIDDITQSEEIDSSDQKLLQICEVISSIQMNFHTQIYGNGQVSYPNSNEASILGELVQTENMRQYRNSSIDKRMLEDSKTILQQREIDEKISPSQSSHSKEREEFQNNYNSFKQGPAPQLSQQLSEDSLIQSSLMNPSKSVSKTEVTIDPQPVTVVQKDDFRKSVNTRKETQK